MATKNLSVQNHPASSEYTVIGDGKYYLSNLPPELILMIGIFACSPPFFEVCPSSRDDYRLRLPFSERCRLLVLSALCLVSKSFNTIFKFELYSEYNFFDTGLDIFSLIPQHSIALCHFRRITLRRSQVKDINTARWSPINPFIEQSMFYFLHEITFTGHFRRYRNRTGRRSDRYYDRTKLTSKCLPCLSSLRFINVVDAELLCLLLFNISSLITSLEIRPAPYGSRYYSFASIFLTLTPLLERFHALKSLTISLPNLLCGNRIYCHDGGEILDRIHRALPNMDSIQSLKIALPLFHCEVEGDFDDHPDFWCRLLKFVSACKNLQEFSFGGDQVSEAVRNQLRSSCSSRFALARYINIPYRGHGKYGPPSNYDRKSVCSPFFYLNQDTDSKYELEQPDDPTDELTDDDDPNMDLFTLENRSVEYDSDDSGHDDELVDDDDSGELKFRNMGKIEGEMLPQGTVEFLVKSKGYGTEDKTRAMSNLEHAKEALLDWLSSQR